MLKVPPGTIIKSVESEEVLADLVEDGQRAIVARGGRGGRGNSRFATPRNPALILVKMVSQAKIRSNFRVEIVSRCWISRFS